MRMDNRARRWLPWALLAIAVLATTAVYWPGVTGGWVFDDYPNIVDNAAIHITQGHSTLAAWVSAALSSPSSFLHRPLASITFAFNWMMGNGNPYPFKVTNIIIHLINGVLLFCMLRALLRLMGARTTVFPHAKSDVASAGAAEAATSGLPALLQAGAAEAATSGLPALLQIDDRAATRLALIVSTAWMLLPINLMAVLYVVQRMESLCQVFVLAGLWAYLHGRWMMLNARDASHDRRGLALATGGIVLGTLLGLTSKETAVLLSVFAFLVEWVVLRCRRTSLLTVGGPEGPTPTAAAEAATMEPSAVDGTPATSTQAGSGLPALLRASREQKTVEASEGDSPARTDKRLWAFFTVTLFIPAVLGFAWLLRGTLKSAAWAGRDFTLAQRLMTEPRVLVDYLRWTIFPNPEVLSLYHDEIVKSTALLTPWTTLCSMLLLAALAVIAIWLRKRRPLVALGIGWFFAAQLLTATIVPLELVYEQRMYFASIGVLLALGSMLLGLRWRISWGLLRGTIVTIALLWFAAATTLRAYEWSDPIRLARVEANRHPESPRAVYEAGRLLLIASNYQPGAMLDESEKYLREAAAIPGASTLSEQALIMVIDHEHHGDDAALWESMAHKLREQPTRQEDISALISLTNCRHAGICKFDVSSLQQAYAAALSRPHPIARLDGAYAAFQRDILHDDALATEYLARAVAGDPSEPAYRIDLAALYARHGRTGQALEQIDALRRLNYGGRLDRQIAALQQLTE